MVDEEFVRSVLRKERPLIASGDFVPVRLTDLMWGVNKAVLFSLFVKKSKEDKTTPFFRLQLRCAKCGDLFTLTVTSVSQVAELFNGLWQNSCVFSSTEIPLNTAIPFSNEVDSKNGTITIFETGKPRCLKCDQTRKGELLPEIIRYDEQWREKKRLLKEEADEKRRLNDDLQNGIIAKYFKPFNEETDPVNDAAVSVLKLNINSIGSDKNIFEERCKLWRDSGDVQNTYYYKLLEYEYERLTPIVCKITKVPLDKTERWIVFRNNTEGEEIFNPLNSFVFINKSLLGVYSKEVLSKKLAEILDSERRALIGSKHILYLHDYMKFGKYRGKPILWIMNHDADYIDWLIDKGYVIQT